MTVTIETRLQAKDYVNKTSGELFFGNEELISYFKDFIPQYNTIFRYVWKVITGPPSELRKKKNKLNTHLQIKFGITKRCAGSIISQAKGVLSAHKELKQYEISQAKKKIKEMERKKKKLKKAIDDLKSKAKMGEITPKELETYKSKRTTYWHLSNKLNRKKQKLTKKQADFDSGKFSICFGTKKLFRAQHNLKENSFRNLKEWKKAFVLNRDKNIYYIGSKDESFGNQSFQLSYNEETDKFDIKVRKHLSNLDHGSKYVLGSCDFKYLKEELKQILINHTKAEPKLWSPVSYRIKRRDKAWYLQAMFDLKGEAYNIKTSCQNGVFAADYNETFIEVCETNEHGHIIKQYRFDLPKKGNSDATLDALRKAAFRLTKLAEKAGKDLVIENLNFDNTKAKMLPAKTKKGKAYNRMLSSFDYSKYKTVFQAACYKRGVYLNLVEPAYSSQKGKSLYNTKMKLSTHQSAAFVLAHRGMNLPD